MGRLWEGVSFSAGSIASTVSEVSQWPVSDFVTEVDALLPSPGCRRAGVSDGRLFRSCSSFDRPGHSNGKSQRPPVSLGSRDRCRISLTAPSQTGPNKVLELNKSEIRISKHEANSNFQNSNFLSYYLFWSFEIWSFRIVSKFVLRI